MPDISVIIPVYNVEKYLRQCLDSVVKQTLHDIEIIIINNGASAAENEIITEYKQADNRIKVINFEQNQGYGKAVNTGLKTASAPYISIVESDDYIDADMYENLYNLIKKYDADIIKSAYKAFTKNEIKIRLNNFNIPQDSCFKLTEYPVFISEHPSIWSCLYKKKFLTDNNIFFIERKGTSWVDNAFQLESLYKADKILYTNKAFYNYRDCRENSSSMLNKALKVPYQAVKDMQDVIDRYNITDSGILYNLALRVMSYIKITVDRADFADIKEITPMINEMFEQIEEDLRENERYKKLKKRFYNKPLELYFIFKKLKSILKFAG